MRRHSMLMMMEKDNFDELLLDIRYKRYIRFLDLFEYKWNNKETLKIELIFVQQDDELDSKVMKNSKSTENQLEDIVHVHDKQQHNINKQTNDLNSRWKTSKLPKKQK